MKKKCIVSLLSLLMMFSMVFTFGRPIKIRMLEDPKEIPTILNDESMNKIQIEEDETPL